SGRPPRTMVIETMTGAVTADPVAILDLPSAVGHTVDGGVVRTSLSSPTIAFDASYETAGATDEVLALDGIEAGDEVGHLDGTCDAWFYDAETLDVPAHRPAEVTVEARSTPWDEFLGDAPALVLYRDNPQELAVKRWENLAVVVPELPFSGLEDRTHEIAGSGSLTGRTTDVVDSDYSYAGDAVVDGDQLTFAVDQQILNALGEAHIYTTGEFDLTSGEGTQTVVDCTGPDLMCSDIERGSTALYAVGDLDAADPDAITWTVDVAVELGGTFGTADSTSSFSATRAG
ncbi:MAG: hypothetical protein KDA98_09520, partial [Acidimicrobiales bacterium]|nr:hypothetical protein [Acidimicrobiales bacterium]